MGPQSYDATSSAPLLPPFAMADAAALAAAAGVDQQPPPGEAADEEEEEDDDDSDEFDDSDEGGSSGFSSLEESESESEFDHVTAEDHAATCVAQRRARQPRHAS